MNMRHQIKQWFNGNGDIPAWIGFLIYGGAAVSGVFLDLVVSKIFEKIEHKHMQEEFGQRLEIAYNAGMLKCFDGEGGELDIQKIKDLFLV